ncbi:MAG: hypothetical protein FWE25_06805 [Lachnospiraceae bacterium]|nr:hypothetical protein [Lachnospiraceae bacterium]
MKKHRFLSVLLVLILLCSIPPPIASLVRAADIQSAMATATPFSTVFEMVSDPDTSIPTWSNTVDPTTGTPIENGRIWTDKSVNVVSAPIFDASGKPTDAVMAAEDEFLVTLSALSQSYTVEALIEPSDTVFVIDVSGSMTTLVGTSGRSRIAVVVDALNEAIGMLMTANPNNRVAVVAFGGHQVSGANVSQIFDVLPLARYSATNNGFFTMSGTTTVNFTGAMVPGSLANTNGFTAVMPSFTVEGGTPTQRGIYRGAKILLDNNDTTYTTTVGTDTYTLIRRPNIILMTDGQPTYGWTDYRFSTAASDTDTGLDSGNGTTSDLGLALLTVLTASYMKQQTHDHYYGGDPSQSTRTVGFYTIGLGDTSDIINATLDPYGDSTTAGSVNADLINQSLSNVNYNMRVLLDSFSQGNTISVPVLNKNSSTQRTLKQIQNYSAIITTDYADMYFSATDVSELADAFHQIAQQIVSQGSYTTLLPGETGASDADFDGYLIFSDVLGQYMEFRELTGFWYDNVKFTVDTLASALEAGDAAAIDKYVTVMLQQQAYQSDGTLMTDAEVRDFISSNVAAGQASPMKYYADVDRNFVSSFFDSTGNPIDPSTLTNAVTVVERYMVEGAVTNPVTNQPTDMIYMAFHVVTILEDGIYPEVYSDGIRLRRSLQAGDHLVRWYIPASLIPQRTVTSVKDANNVPTGEIQIVEAAPIRAIYSVGMDIESIYAGLSPAYTGTARYQVSGREAYYLYTNRWLSPSGFSNATDAFFMPGAVSPYYFEETRLYSERTQTLKATNTTQTSPTSFYPRYFTINPVVQVHELGNNGRLVLDTTSLTVLKEWDAALGDLIVPVYVQLYDGDGNPVGSPIELDPASTNATTNATGGIELMYTWENLPLYALTPDAAGNAVLMSYTVVEGSYDGGVFTPFGPGNEPPWIVIDFPPRWDDASGTWEDAQIFNIAEVPDQRIIVLEKNFEGLTSQQVLDALGTNGSIEFDVYKGTGGVFGATPDESLYYPDDFINGRTILNISGVFDSIKLVEKYHEIPNYDWTLSYDALDVPGHVTVNLEEEPPDYVLTLTDVEDGDVITLGLTNIYEVADPPKLTVRKEFAPGSSLGWDDIHDNIVFSVVGTDESGNVIYLDMISFADMMAAMSSSNTGVGILQEDAPVGYYTITEYGQNNSIAANDPLQHTHTATVTFTVVDGSGDVASTTGTDGSGNPYTTFWLGYGDDVIATVINSYVRRAGLIIEKEIVVYDEQGDVTEITVPPEGIAFLIVGASGQALGTALQVTYDMFIDGKFVLTDLPTGGYYITETGGNMTGFDGPTVSVTINDGDVNLSDAGYFEIADGGIDMTVHFVNVYQEQSGNMTLVKSFTGLPDGVDPLEFVSDISFTIIGFDFNDDSIVVFRETVWLRDFVYDANTGTYSYDLTELPFGIYHIYESGGLVEGMFSPSLDLGFVPIRDENLITIPMTNAYTELPPPTSPRLQVVKVFHGLTPDEVTSLLPDFAIDISGPNDWFETVGAAGGIFEDLEYGDYTITERNYAASGYSVVTSPELPYTVNFPEGQTNTDIMVVIDNTYTEDTFDLTIQKTFVGLDQSLIPTDFQLIIEGPQNYVRVLTLEEALAGVTITGLFLGEYRIRENNVTVPGYHMVSTPELPYTFTADATTETIVIDITNTYERDKGSLTIYKQFTGLPAGTAVSTISFLIIGTDDDGNEIYRNTIFYDHFVDGKYVLTDLPTGNYVIYESGGYADGFMLLLPGPLVVTPPLSTDGAEAVVNIENTYVELPASVTPALRVRKAFHGLLPGEIPSGFAIDVSGPNGFFETVGVGGGFWENLELGDYVIQERNYEMDGFVVTSTPELPYTVHITEEDDNIMVTIDNFYTEPPTQPPTEPPTEPPTTPITEPPTEPPTTPVTEPPTEPVTEPPTTPATEPPTNPATVPPTTPPTSPGTPKPPDSEIPDAGDHLQIRGYIALLLAGIGLMSGVGVYAYKYRRKKR